MMVTVEPYSRKRTIQQNKAYWKVIIKPIEDATGHPSKVWHEYFKTLFIEPDVVSLGGKILEIRESTTDMTTKKFSEYIENIRKWCGENLNLSLPEIES